MIVEKLILIGIVIMAIATLSTASLRRAVIYLGLFSLLASFSYLLYRAPDVAIAEATIGCGLSTVLFLVALKRQRLMTIYYIHGSLERSNDQTVPRLTVRLLHDIETRFASKDLETQVIHTTKAQDEIIRQKDFDLLAMQEGQLLTIYGHAEDYHLDDVADLLANQPENGLKTRIVRLNEGEG